MFFTGAESGPVKPPGPVRPLGSTGMPGGEGQSHVFRSQALELFARRIEQTKNPVLLDVGPVCSANINLWAALAKTLHVCDMFIRLQRQKKAGDPIEEIWGQLDYPDGLFHGIFCWDLLDRLEENQARLFVKRCLEMMRPGGMMLISALPEDAHTAEVSSFVQWGDFEISLKHQPHLKLRLHPKQNRRTLSLLLPFFPVKSFIYRNGYREFLVQKP